MHRFIDEELGYFEKAEDELKRVDHLIYVSLKYTRTVDVIKNTLNRMIATFDHIMDGLLDAAEKDGKLFKIPTSPGAKVNEVKKIYSDVEVIGEMLTFYAFLRKVFNADYEAVKEFRRHVAMIAKMQDGTIEEINIDIITDFYNKCKELVEQLRDEFLE